MCVNVFDVAVYILKQLKKLSTVKLQRLCYYSQAWSLVWDDEPLFDEDFYAWDNGPICKVLYYHTRGSFSVQAEDEPGNDDNLTEAQKNNINEVLQYYSPHNAQWLSQLARLEDPWREARKGVTDGHPYDSVISKESMAMYYGGLDDEENKIRV